MREYLNITNECNIELMKRYDDNHFDLAIVDPPYGIGQNKNNGKSIGLRKKWSGYDKKKYTPKNWDNKPPTEDYFKELFRVSKNQIIWGANYFNLKPTKGIIAWDKQCDGTGFSHFELAWSSFDKSANIFRYPIQGESQNRIHPTQKPVQLYKWLLTKYAQDGFKIIDTHLGSGSIAIALDSVNKYEKMNLTLTACELDKEHYKNAINRIDVETRQESLFA